MAHQPRQGGVQLRKNPDLRRLYKEIQQRDDEDRAWEEFYRRSLKRRSDVLCSRNQEGR